MKRCVWIIKESEFVSLLIYSSDLIQANTAQHNDEVLCLGSIATVSFKLKISSFSLIKRGVLLSNTILFRLSCTGYSGTRSVFAPPLPGLTIPSVVLGTLVLSLPCRVYKATVGVQL
jgi:hypothetical protein